MRLQILLAASAISAYPLNFSDSSVQSNNINEILLGAKDNNINFIRRAYNPIQRVGQGINGIGTGILGGLKGGILTNNYKDTGLVAEIIRPVNGILQSVFGSRF